MYLFISGRYEYRNKGIDLFIEFLPRLNRHGCARAGIPVNIVAFIITRGNYKNINVDVLRNQSMFDELSKMCESITDEMGLVALPHGFRVIASGPRRADDRGSGDPPEARDARLAHLEAAADRHA